MLFSHDQVMGFRTEDHTSKCHFEHITMTYAINIFITNDINHDTWLTYCFIDFSTIKLTFPLYTILFGSKSLNTLTNKEFKVILHQLLKRNIST